MAKTQIPLPTSKDSGTKLLLRVDTIYSDEEGKFKRVMSYFDFIATFILEDTNTKAQAMYYEGGKPIGDASPLVEEFLKEDYPEMYL